MIEYLNLIPLQLHIIILIYVFINHNNDKYMIQRMNPHVESPLNWQEKRPSLFEYVLALYEGLISTLLIISISLLIGYKIKWYYAVFLYLEFVIIGGLFIGLINTLLIRIFNTNLFSIQRLCNRTRILTIFIDGYLFYNLFKIIINY
ncbi:hypothetical protein SDC9_162014 [bioreactor metagenome]|uniref:Uncharacterized protein n=1 Tax=bioreactor metagenome TaxID=1076179 RepID=A0A645FJW1_9ZZZZ